MGQSFCRLTSSGVDIRKEVQKLPNEDADLDEDQADMLKVGTCLLASAAVKTAKANSWKRRIRRARKSKSAWMN